MADQLYLTMSTEPSWIAALRVQLMATAGAYRRADQLACAVLAPDFFADAETDATALELAADERFWPDRDLSQEELRMLADHEGAAVTTGERMPRSA